MDEYPWQTTSGKPFSKGPTKYEEVGRGGGGGKVYSKGSNKKVRWYIHTYMFFYLECYTINSVSTTSK